MIYQIGFVPTMYVAQTMCENREKRRNSANRNYQRTVYEFAENGEMERFGEMLNEEIGKLRQPNRYVG